MLENKQIYNNLEDIDQLIEQLEQNIPKSSIASSRVDEAIQKRKRQIVDLKMLRDYAQIKAVEERELQRIDAENQQIDEVIKGFKKLVKVAPKETFQSSSESNYGSSESNYGCSNVRSTSNYYNSSSESRSGGESRW